MSDCAEKPAEPQLVRGVDVSHYQGAIDWTRVAATGARFGIAKATEGVTYTDDKYDANIAGMRRASIATGAYHFARGGDVMAEARHFVTVIAREPPDTILALDLEAAPGHGWGPEAGPWALAWLEEVERFTGVTPWLYVSPSFARQVRLDLTLGIGRYPLWIAHWTHAPEPSVPPPWMSNRHWTAWQYSNTAHVDGIRGDVDVNHARLVL